MKTVIGFVCGVVGFVSAVIVFVLGVVAGFKLGISDKVSVNKKNPDPDPAYNMFRANYEKKED